MSTSRLQHTVNHFREQLHAQEDQALRTLDAAHKRILHLLQPELNKLYTAIEEKLASDEEVPATWLYEHNRLETIKQLIARTIDQFAAFARMQASSLQHYGVELGKKAAMEFLQATVPDGVAWSFGLPSPRAISELVGATADGSPLTDLFTGFGEEAARKAGDALLRGVSVGRNPRQIASEIEDALQISRNRALTIAKQEMLRCYKSANTETYRANDDVVEQWRWTAALSGRTCAACIAMDGTLHDLSEDLESHVCCRCQPVPVTRSWQDILADAGIDTSSLDLPESQPVFQNGSDWLDQQSEEVQKQVLGNKYQGWSNGDFTLQDLVEHTHDPQWGRSIKVKPLKALV